MTTSVIQTTVIHHVQFSIPLHVRTIPYYRVNNTLVWRPGEPDRTGLERYAHTLVKAIIVQMFGDSLEESGFACGGEMWYFVLNVKQCRFTISSISEFCQCLNEMIHSGAALLQAESVDGEPTKFTLPEELLLKLSTKGP